MPKALITGITGQDGSYLAEFLLEHGYEVIGMVRRTSTTNFDRIRDFQDRITIVQGDLLDQVSLINLLQEHQSGRGVQPGRAELRANELYATGAHR